MKRAWFAVPSVGFDTDDGLGFGAHGELAAHQEGYEPYRSLWVAQIYASLWGYNDHRLEWDRVGAGPGGKTRLQVGLYWRQWQNSGYWGMGNATLRERTWVGEFGDDDPARKHYRFSLLQPMLHAMARTQLGSGPWSLHGAATLRYTRVDAYAGSLLEDDRPYGMLGGWSPQVRAGIIHDSRRPEIAPHKGVFAELTGRFAPAVDGEAGGFGGGLAMVAGYVPLSDQVVLAGRLMGEALWGTVPFYEMNFWGAAQPVVGFGGNESIRGIPMGRWRGPSKALANLELRWTLWSFTLKDHLIALETAPFFDAGSVFGADEQAADLPSTRAIHPAGGVGGRIVFDQTFVGRLDLGWAPDPILEPDGSITEATNMGIYFVFGHPF